MFTSLRSQLSAMPRWLQFAAVLVAGAASFYVSFALGPRKQHATADNTIVAAKPPLSAASATAMAAAVATPAVPAALAEPASRPSAPSRLAAGILQNPFAPLNLHASTDKPVVVAAAEHAPVKKPVRKPVAPPVVAAPVPPLPPPPPTAPPLPFVVLGAIRGPDIAQGKQVVFLSEKGASLVVSQGDDIHGTYKVEAITANAIEFTYLPLGQRQSLPLAH